MISMKTTTDATTIDGLSRQHVLYLKLDPAFFENFPCDRLKFSLLWGAMRFDSETNWFSESKYLEIMKISDQLSAHAACKRFPVRTLLNPFCMWREKWECVTNFFSRNEICFVIKTRAIWFFLYSHPATDETAIVHLVHNKNVSSPKRWSRCRLIHHNLTLDETSLGISVFVIHAKTKKYSMQKQITHIFWLLKYR